MGLILLLKANQALFCVESGPEEDADKLDGVPQRKELEDLHVGVVDPALFRPDQ